LVGVNDQTIAEIQRVHVPAQLQLLFTAQILGRNGFGLGAIERRQQQRRQDGDDRNHHQQLN
jgi:hypothetical protein